MADSIPSQPIISAQEAFEAGKVRYFTGKPCKNGHIAERYVRNSSCVECLEEKRIRRLSRYAEEPERRRENYQNVKAWREGKPEKRTEEARRYREKYPDRNGKTRKKYREAHLEEVRDKDRVAHAEWRKQYPEMQKARMERYKAREEQKRIERAGRPKPDVCDICGGFDWRIVFDHCHASGDFRGWLCDRCNRVLGIVKDDPKYLARLMAYLENHNGRTKSRQQE